MYGDYASDDVEQLESFRRRLHEEFPGPTSTHPLMQADASGVGQGQGDAAAREIEHCRQLLDQIYTLDLTILGMEETANAEMATLEEKKDEFNTLLDKIIGIAQSWQRSNRTWTADEDLTVKEINHVVRRFTSHPLPHTSPDGQGPGAVAMEFTASQDITDSSRSQTPSQLTGSSGNTDPAFSSALALPQGLGSNTSAHSQLANRFFELCVDTGALSISLAEIPLTYCSGVHEIRTDTAFFALLNTRYHSLRRRRLLGFLFKPVDIQFVRFGVVDSHCVGIYAQPKEIPPPKEVYEQRYHYHECPLNPLPPIDRRTFFHYFWNHEQHAGCQSRLFFDRMPKKLHSSVLKQCGLNQLKLGWGVRIIEGPNKPLLSLCLCIILVLSFVVSLTLALALKTQESGFGVGQWMVAALSAALAAVYFHLAES